MVQPSRFEDPKCLENVYKLHNPLYGLKQAPRAWFDKLQSALALFCFQSSKSDQTLFVRITIAHSTFILVYVESILVTGNDSQVITNLITNLYKEFALKDLGLVNYFLGFQVTHTSYGLHLSQMKYIIDILARAKMRFAKGFTFLMNGGQTLIAFGSDVIVYPQLYISIARAL